MVQPSGAGRSLFDALQALARNRPLRGQPCHTQTGAELDFLTEGFDGADLIVFDPGDDEVEAVGAEVDGGQYRTLGYLGAVSLPGIPYDFLHAGPMSDWFLLW